LTSPKPAAYPTASVLAVVLSEAAKGLPDNEAVLTTTRVGPTTRVCLSQEAIRKSFSDVRLGEVICLASIDRNGHGHVAEGLARDSFEKSAATLPKLDRVLAAVLLGERGEWWLNRGMHLRVEWLDGSYTVHFSGLEGYIGGDVFYEVSRDFMVTKTVGGY